MLDLIFWILLAFLIGILVKLVDNIEDKKGGRNVLKWPMAAAYGLGVGYVISQAPFSTIFLGALFAQVVAGKIDRQSHALAFLMAVILSVYLGLPAFDLLPFVIFFAAAYLDELSLFGILKTFADYRLFLILATLPFAVLGRVDYLLGIASFDAGYILTERLFR